MRVGFSWVFFFLFFNVFPRHSCHCQDSGIAETVDFINTTLRAHPARNRPSAGPYIHQINIENEKQLVIYKKIMKQEHIAQEAYYFTIDKIWVPGINLNKSFQHCGSNSGEIVFYCSEQTEQKASIQLLNNQSFDKPTGSIVPQQSINILFDFGVGNEMCSAFKYLFALINASQGISDSNIKTFNKNAAKDHLSATTDIIELIRAPGNTYEIPVIINGVLAINVIFDTGASDLSLSPDVALTLYRTGTIKDSDYIGSQTYRFADGSKAKSDLFRIHEIKIGKFKIYNVTASISNSLEAPLLLGQNVLSQLGKITIDYNKHLLYVTR